jgi:hypothetical protein
MPLLFFILIELITLISMFYQALLQCSGHVLVKCVLWPSSGITDTHFQLIFIYQTICKCIL